MQVTQTVKVLSGLTMRHSVSMGMSVEESPHTRILPSDRLTPILEQSKRMPWPLVKMPCERVEARAYVEECIV